jgi:hypothetical protein
MNLSPTEKLFLKHFGRGVLIYLAFGGVILLSINAQVEKKSNLRNSGTGAVAHITSTECSNHGKLSYDFSIRENVIKGTSSSCNLTCADVKVGDTLEIKYLSDEPTVNDCEFIVNGVDSSVGTLLGLLVFTMVYFLLVSISYMRELEEIDAKSS